MAERLKEHELDALRFIAKEPQECFNGQTGTVLFVVCLESLQRSGHVTRSLPLRVTDKGLAALSEGRK